MNSTPPQLITLSELAQTLVMPAFWLRKEARLGHIPSITIAGTELRFDPDAVKQALAQQAGRWPGYLPESIQLVSAIEMARQIGVGRQCFDEMVTSKRIPHFRFGAKRLFNPEIVGPYLIANALRAGLPFRKGKS